VIYVLLDNHHLDVNFVLTLVSAVSSITKSLAHVGGKV